MLRGYNKLQRLINIVTVSTLSGTTVQRRETLLLIINLNSYRFSQQTLCMS